MPIPVIQRIASSGHHENTIIIMIHAHEYFAMEVDRTMEAQNLRLDTV